MNRFKFRVFAPLINSYNYFDLTEIIKVNTDYTIQQCLGIKDKKGRYIYEGDVVKLNNSLGEIIWGAYTCGFVVTCLIGDDFYSNYDCWSDLEVVGSIANEYFIALDNTVSKLTTPEDLVKQLGV